MAKSNHTVNESQLEVNKFILVRGNIEYSRLVHKIEGEELEKDKKRKLQAGMIPVEKPYTTVQLTNARIIPMSPTGQKSLEETFVEERFYKRKNDPAGAPMHYSIVNKSEYDNLFYQAVDGKTTEGDQIYPTHELANGLDVLLILRVFQSKSNFGRKSIALHSIIIEEPVRYYVGANTAALQEAGIILRDTPKPETEKATAAPAAPAAPVSAPAPGQAFATAPAVKEPEGPWTCPTCGELVPAGQVFCGKCGSRKPEASANNNPFVAQAQQAQNGIRFNPDDTRRDY